MRGSGLIEGVGIHPHLDECILWPSVVSHASPRARLRAHAQVPPLLPRPPPPLPPPLRRYFHFTCMPIRPPAAIDTIQRPTPRACVRLAQAPLHAREQTQRRPRCWLASGCARGHGIAGPPPARRAMARWHRVGAARASRTALGGGGGAGAHAGDRHGADGARVHCKDQVRCCIRIATTRLPRPRPYAVAPPNSATSFAPTAGSISVPSRAILTSRLAFHGLRRPRVR